MADDVSKGGGASSRPSGSATPADPSSLTPLDPLSSVSALAATLDAQPDIPSFLNSLLPFPSSSLPKHVPSTPPDLGALDKSLADLLALLSMLYHDTLAAQEQAIHDISRTVPRLTYDLQFMLESATSLHTSLSLVQDRVARQAVTAEVAPTLGSVSITAPTGALSTSTTAASISEVGVAGATSEEARTRVALEKLSQLDLLKTRMESARDILREAESWSTLESEISSLITSLAWSKAADRLAEANRSLIVFQNTPGEYDSRRALLVSLQNQLEAALSAALKDALAAVDTDACSRFYAIFETMDRGAEFKNYYFDARRLPIVNEWSEAGDRIVEIASGQSHDAGVISIRFSSFLPKFYATILSTLNTERLQIPLVFAPTSTSSSLPTPTSTPAAILISFLQTTLDALSPSMHDRLDAVAEYHGAEALPELLHVYKSTEELASAVRSIIDKLAPPPPLPTPRGATTPTGTAGTPPILGADERKDLDHPPALGRTNSAKSARLFSASQTAPTPTETTSLASLSLDLETGLFEPFLDLQSSYATLEGRYLTHLGRTDPSLSVSPSLPASSARPLADRTAAAFGFIDDAITRCAAFTRGFGILGLVDAANTLLAAVIADTPVDSKDRRRGMSAGAAGSTGLTTSDELDFEGLDYSTEDWAAFQYSLGVLGSCRTVLDRFTVCEESLRLALAQVDLDTPALVRSSPLNSAALHTALSSLSSTSPSSTPSAVQLLPARNALTALTRSAQSSIQTTILAPLHLLLSSYASLPIWSQAEKPTRPGQLHVPTFSLSPTDTIARVAEGLLNLLRVFEVYATDQALGYSLETLPHIDGAEVKAAIQAAAAERASEEEETKRALVAGSGVIDLDDDTVPSQLKPATSTSTSTISVTAPPELVLSTWVFSLSLSLLSHMTRSVLPSIRYLSGPGAEQLACDLGYLSNAVRALDVEHEEMEAWREAVEADEEAWRKKVGERDGSGKGANAWGQVGRARGWN